MRVGMVVFRVPMAVSMGVDYDRSRAPALDAILAAYLADSFTFGTFFFRQWLPPHSLIFCLDLYYVADVASKQQTPCQTPDKNMGDSSAPPPGLPGPNGKKIGPRIVRTSVDSRDFLTLQDKHRW